jgi:hypothetical protein
MDAENWMVFQKWMEVNKIDQITPCKTTLPDHFLGLYQEPLFTRVPRGEQGGRPSLIHWEPRASICIAEALHAGEMGQQTTRRQHWRRDIG